MKNKRGGIQWSQYNHRLCCIRRWGECVCYIKNEWMRGMISSKRIGPKFQSVKNLVCQVKKRKYLFRSKHFSIPFQYNNNVADWNRWRWTCDVNNMTRWRGRRNWWIRCHPPIRLHVAPLKSKHTPPQSQHISFEILSLLLITPRYKLLGVLLFHLFVISECDDDDDVVHIFHPCIIDPTLSLSYILFSLVFGVSSSVKRKRKDTTMKNLFRYKVCCAFYYIAAG